MGFKFRRLEIPDIVLVEADVNTDERGFFMETYKYPVFAEFGIKENFIQDNNCRTVKKGIIRGLHYQLRPMAQGKLIRVTAGEIFDVAVDIRKNSPYYGKWVREILSSQNRKILYLPEGFAHGYCTLTDTAEILYKCTNVYSKEHERGIIWNDTDIGIDWPVERPLLSKRDGELPTLKEADNNFAVDEPPCCC